MHQLHLHTQQGSYLFASKFPSFYERKSFEIHCFAIHPILQLMFSCHKQTLLLCHLPCVTSWHQVPQWIYSYSQDTVSMYGSYYRNCNLQSYLLSFTTMTPLFMITLFSLDLNLKGFVFLVTSYINTIHILIHKCAWNVLAHAYTKKILKVFVQ